ncbi:MAG: type I-D CRISPR-associated protein Cas7/Csc2 [Ardenticatenaceae bacterium]|nr:type I-D CRISPR-associated protein Cas7/Csc2 [Ardenticatenaceae bacterium]
MSLRTDWFPTAVPPKPTGHYTHIVALRVTHSYPLFQTDGELNTARVAAGEQNREVITRLTVFKRKQTTPERLVGRELLRHYGLLSSETVLDPKKHPPTDGENLPICDYNVSFCMQCPDCITYGFAIGESGSEKSKVITDTAYSLTPYASSHEAFTLNAPYEDGTMSRQGGTTSRFNEQDHVLPQVIFPCVITVRDATASLFRYVLNNVLHTRRYGAQTTRTGRVQNHVLAIVLADGEVFSNLRFTQRLYDRLHEEGAIAPPDPVDEQRAIVGAQALLPDLLREDGVTVTQLLMGEDLADWLADLQAELADGGMRVLLQQAFDDSRTYYARYIAKKK